MALYHSAPILLGNGSIILPGNYGRIVNAVGKNHVLWRSEMELEAARKQRFSEKPSRLTSAFACTSIDTARFYMHVPAFQGRLAFSPVLYEVEKAEPDAPEHRTDFNLIQPLPRRRETMSEIATLYWTAGLWITITDAPGIRCEEVVTPSPLRVVRRIE
jgi:hypothetical protein